MSLPKWAGPFVAGAAFAAFVLGNWWQDAETRANASDERARDAKRRADASEQQTRETEAHKAKLEQSNAELVQKVRALEAGKTANKPSTPRKTNFPKPENRGKP